MRCSVRAQAHNVFPNAKYNAVCSHEYIFIRMPFFADQAVLIAGLKKFSTDKEILALHIPPPTMWFSSYFFMPIFSPQKFIFEGVCRNCLCFFSQWHSSAGPSFHKICAFFSWDLCSFRCKYSQHTADMISLRQLNERRNPRMYSSRNSSLLYNAARRGLFLASRTIVHSWNFRDSWSVVSFFGNVILPSVEQSSAMVGHPHPLRLNECRNSGSLFTPTFFSSERPRGPPLLRKR